MPPGRDTVAALLDKYRQMRAMRRAAVDGSESDPRPRMAALAARFPGALREIDELPMAAIDERITVLEGALGGSPAPAWVAWSGDYHGILRAALRLKRALRGVALDDACARLSTTYAPEADEPEPSFWTRERLAAVLRPRGGRLNPWVFEQIAGRHAVDVETVIEALFPHRHR